MIEDEQLFTIKDTAELLKLSKAAVERLELNFFMQQPISNDNRINQEVEPASLLEQEDKAAQVKAAEAHASDERFLHSHVYATLAERAAILQEVYPNANMSAVKLSTLYRNRGIRKKKIIKNKEPRV